MSSLATSGVLATTQCVEPRRMCIRGPIRDASSWKVRCTGGRSRCRCPITGRLVGPGGNRACCRHEEIKWRKATTVTTATSARTASGLFFKSDRITMLGLELSGCSSMAMILAS